jgi:hypothetical protein
MNGRISANARLISAAIASVLRKRRSSSSRRVHGITSVRACSWPTSRSTIHSYLRRSASSCASQTSSSSTHAWSCCRFTSSSNSWRRDSIAPMRTLERFDVAASLAQPLIGGARGPAVPPEQRRTACLAEALQCAARFLQQLMLPAFRCELLELRIGLAQVVHEDVEPRARLLRAAPAGPAGLPGRLRRPWEYLNLAWLTQFRSCRLHAREGLPRWTGVSFSRTASDIFP